MTPLVLRLNHTGFTVSDLDGPLAWLVDGLGFRLLSRAGRPHGLATALTGVANADVEIAFLEGPGLVVELLRYKAPARPQTPMPDPATPGAAHLALDVSDIDAAIAVSQRFGAQILGRVVTVPAGSNIGARLAYVAHPAGIALELIQQKESG